MQIDNFYLTSDVVSSFPDTLPVRWTDGLVRNKINLSSKLKLKLELELSLAKTNKEDCASKKRTRMLR